MALGSETEEKSDGIGGGFVSSLCEKRQGAVFVNWSETQSKSRALRLHYMLWECECCALRHRRNWSESEASCLDIATKLGSGGSKAVGSDTKCRQFFSRPIHSGTRGNM